MTIRQIFNAILDFNFLWVVGAIAVIWALIIYVQLIAWFIEQIHTFFKIVSPSLFAEDRSPAAIRLSSILLRSIQVVVWGFALLMPLILLEPSLEVLRRIARN